MNFLRRLIPVFILKRLVIKNMEDRMFGYIPDTWYWADVELRRRTGWESPIWDDIKIYFKRYRCKYCRFYLPGECDYSGCKYRPLVHKDDFCQSFVKK